MGRVAATFHGHGVPEEDEGAMLSRFLRKVDEGVRELVGGEPLVLAGVPELTSLYREISEHGSIVEETVRGNPDDSTPEEIHERAWSLAEPALRARADEDRKRFEESPDLAMTDLQAIFTAALAGRIEAVWVDLDSHVWGTVSKAGEIDVADDAAAGRRDLTDAAAIEAWCRSGRVHVAEDVPGNGPIAALARYPA
jgi:hypothetical protein